MDRLTSTDGKPLNLDQYKAIFKECCFIADQFHMSIYEVLDMAIPDRKMALDYIAEKQDSTKKAMEEAKAKAKSKR